MVGTTTITTDELPGDMDFAHRLIALRKNRGLTQQALAERVGIHVSQIRRYEAGDSQPNLDALRNLALALSTSTDALVFDEAERGPQDDLRLQFEATARLDDDGKNLVKALLEAVLLRHEARRWTHAAS
jgi:transcriptional regulator with XRE-family HTH domain